MNQLSHDKARAVVNSAIKRGTIIKPNYCSECLELTPSRQLHAHHDNYEQPLVIKWLCKSCHVDEHFPHRAGMPRQSRGAIGAVRISEEYLEKLRKLADDKKRSMTKTLEVLIDGAQ